MVRPIVSRACSREFPGSRFPGNSGFLVIFPHFPGPFYFPGNGKFEKPKVPGISREFPGIPGIPDLSFPGKRGKWPKIVNFPGNGIPGIPRSKLYSWYKDWRTKVFKNQKEKARLIQMWSNVQGECPWWRGHTGNLSNAPGCPKRPQRNCWIAIQTWWPTNPSSWWTWEFQKSMRIDVEIYFEHEISWEIWVLKSLT